MLPTYHTRYLLTKAEIQIIFNAHSKPSYKRLMQVFIKYKICPSTESIRLNVPTLEGKYSRARFHEFFYPEDEKDDSEEKSQLITEQREMDLL